MEKNKIAIYQQFLQSVEDRLSLVIKGNLEAFLDYAEYSIKSEFDKGGKKNIKHKKKKDMFQERFLQAYNSQSITQKLEEYIRIVSFLKNLKEGRQVIEELEGEQGFTDVYCLSYNLHLWKKKELRLNMSKGQMYCEKDHKVKFYDLRNYLIRQSKNTDYNCFVLQAINTQPHHKSLTVRIGFKDLNKYRECFKLVKATIIKMQKIRIKEQLGISILPISTIQGLGVHHQPKPHKQAISNLTSDIKVEQSLVKKQQKQKQKQQYKQKQNEKQIEKQALFSPQKNQSEVIQCQSFRSQIKHESQQSDQQIQTIAMSLLACDSNQEMYSIEEKESQTQNSNKKNLDVFHQIVPDYELESLTDDTGFQLVHTQHNGKIFHHREQNHRYKVTITVQQSNTIKLFQTLARVQNYAKWNTAVQEVLIKSILKSQNVAVIYQKHKAMSKIYRARDFVFMRHVFKMNGNLYILDKSIENASYPPFMTIVRGDLQIILGIIKKGSGHIIAADIQIQNQGYINDSQNHNLSMLFLKGLMGIQQYLKSTDNVQVQWDVFDLDWDITNKANKKHHHKDKFMQSGEKNFVKLKKSQDKKKSIKQQKKQLTKIQKQKTGDELNDKKINQTSPDKIQQTSKPVEKVLIQPPKLQIKTQELKTSTKSIQEADEINQVVDSPKSVHISINYEFDKNGLVLIPQGYLKSRYSFSPQAPKPILYQQVVQGHPIWKGEWRVDYKNGGIIFINQQKIADQKGVIKFILSKIAKNLLSGKSVLNISLPVDIFGYESNLQRLAFGMTYAPILVEKAVAEPDPIEKLKIIAGFGLTNSALYLSMQKPFNSILGQTFQGWMNGCPIYMQQISHHPPIASFMLFGRGYKMTGHLQSKVQVHMNSGCGTNEGFYKIMMDDGSDFNFITPGGQIAGISYGDRKFNLVGKYYVWSKKHRLFLEMIMDPCSKKGFLSKRQHTTDYIEGYVKQVTQKFLNDFEKQSQKERDGPSKTQTLKVICKANGIWHKSLFFEDKQYLNLDKQFGCKLQYDKHLLPSDGNWREDLAYRRKKDIVRAQTQKERLQNLQRGDRKLRQKYHGKH